MSELPIVSGYSGLALSAKNWAKEWLRKTRPAWLKGSVKKAHPALKRVKDHRGTISYQRAWVVEISRRDLPSRWFGWTQPILAQYVCAQIGFEKCRS